MVASEEARAAALVEVQVAEQEEASVAAVVRAAASAEAKVEE